MLSTRSAEDTNEQFENCLEAEDPSEGVREKHIINNGPNQKRDDDFGGAFLEEYPKVFFLGKQEITAHHKENGDTIT
jgi:hypothetical protein